MTPIDAMNIVVINTESIPQRQPVKVTELLDGYGKGGQCVFSDKTE